MQDSSLAALSRQMDEICQEAADRFGRMQVQLTDLAPAVQQLHKR